MRDRLHRYSPAELDRLIWRVFSEWPDEAFVARRLGLRESDIAASLERFATKVAVLGQIVFAGLSRRPGPPTPVRRERGGS